MKATSLRAVVSRSVIPGVGQAAGPEQRVDRAVLHPVDGLGQVQPLGGDVGLRVQARRLEQPVGDDLGARPRRAGGDPLAPHVGDEVMPLPVLAITWV